MLRVRVLSYELLIVVAIDVMKVVTNTRYTFITSINQIKNTVDNNLHSYIKQSIDGKQR